MKNNMHNSMKNLNNNIFKVDDNFPLNHYYYLSDLIMKLLSDKTISEIIDDILEYTLNFYNADRVYILNSDRTVKSGFKVYEKSSKNPTSKSLYNSIPNKIGQKWINLFFNGVPLIVRDVEKIRNKFNIEYEFLKSQGIENIIAITYNNGEVKGFIGVNNAKTDFRDGFMLNIMSYLISLNLLSEQRKQNLIYTIKSNEVISKDEIFVKTFGDFEINTFLRDFNLLNVNSKQAILFFVYLLLNKDKIVPIETISNTFWPNQYILEPYSYIKNLVFRTRKVLFNIFGCDLIIANQGSYSINPLLNIITDYDLVQLLHEEAKNNISTELKLNNYYKIIELYDNKMFSNLPQETWMTVITNKYHLIYIETVNECIKILNEQKEYDKILSILEKSLKIDDKIYDFHYHTIQVYLLKQQISIAETHLKSCKELLSAKEYEKLLKIINNFE